MLVYKLLEKRQNKERWYSKEEDNISSNVYKKTILEKWMFLVIFVGLISFYLSSSNLEFSIAEIILEFTSTGLLALLFVLIVSNLYYLVKYYMLYKNETNKYKWLYLSRIKLIIFETVIATLFAFIFYNLYGLSINHYKIIEIQKYIENELYISNINILEILIGENSHFIIAIEIIILITLLYIFLKDKFRIFMTGTFIKNVRKRAKSGDFHTIKRGLDNEIHFDKKGILYGADFSMILKGISELISKLKIKGIEEGASEVSKNELITNVSHDLKTPLTSIINYTYILKNKDYTEDERRKYISILKRKSKRLNDILLELKGEENYINDFSIEKENVFYMIEDCVNEYKSKLIESNIGIIFENSIDEIVSFNRKNTLRVIQNIIDNIKNYAKENSNLLISFSQDNEYITAKFENISKYEMNFKKEDALRRFWRGDLSRHTEGNGLGLDICKSLMEKQNGVFDVEIKGDYFINIIKFRRR
ncbi:sensor histidine kinase [Clostridium baratii]|uniref:histidine kinase n=1 Tax=Clostridium baratii TaxID=1561 RepID=A0A174SW36_9CLOT|nr:HAMP domain-containing sensor histidine kinase [Clostridium baratii]CUP99615.1 sensor histidine kinase [Clostridium baratii]